MFSRALYNKLVKLVDSYIDNKETSEDIVRAMWEDLIKAHKKAHAEGGADV